MNRWKTAAAVAVAVSAAGVGAALAPAAHGQTRVARVQGSRALEVLTGGSRIGVSIRDVEDGDTKNPKGVNAGVLVDEVSTDSPAEKAGIRKGDAIVEFDGERVRSVRQLTRLVQETAPGRTVSAILQRDGQRTTVSVTPRDDSSFSFRGFEDLSDWGREFRYRLAPRTIAPPAPPTPPNRPTPPTPPSPPMVWDFDGMLGRAGRLGTSIDSLSPQLAEYFGTKEGVLVTSVSDDSVAAKAGLKAGDVITSVNGSTVREPQDLRRRLQNLDDGDELTIGVMRDRKTVTLKGKAERTDRRRSSRTIL
jgi:membrane-associated protease RseP (regulator of RpoE activity)